MQRRAFIEGVLAGSATVAVSSAAVARPGANPTELARPEAPTPSEKVTPTPADPTSLEEVLPLLAPLAIGDVIGLGWRVQALSGVSRGAAVLTLRDESERDVRVHLCRRAPGSAPIAHSQSIDLFLMNEGDGAAPTDETLGRVLNVLAILISHNEKHGASASEAMLPHEARLLFFRAERALV
ncbi:MAG: hypothetical protein U0263_35130 [Polyangiaceae bacterium]